MGAISIEEREAAPYNERQVMANIVKAGDNTIRAHLRHLESHGESGYLQEARAYLQELGLRLAEEAPAPQEAPCGCPGSQARELRKLGARARGARARSGGDAARA